MSEPTEIDWEAQWEARMALNFKIAQLLETKNGWKAKHTPGDPAFTNEREWEEYYLVLDEGMQFRPIPDYAADLNALLVLLPKDNSLYHVAIYEQVAPYGFIGVIFRADPPLGQTGRWEGSGATRAEALARALLALLTDAAP